MSNNENSSGSFLVAFALGLVAGAAVALLYAPASGDDTRRKVADKAREAAENARRMAREGREAFEQARQEAQ